MTYFQAHLSAAHTLQGKLFFNSLMWIKARKSNQAGAFVLVRKFIRVSIFANPNEDSVIS